MITYAYPDLFITEGTQKSLLITDGTVTVSGTTYTVTDETIKFENSDIEGEAFELYQSMNSAMQITFGSCETGRISFTVRKSFNTAITGTVVTVYLIPNNDASKMLQLGVFKIAEDVESQNHDQHSIVAYDAMYDILNANVVEWYNTFFASYPSGATIAQFRAAFLTNFNVTAESVTLCNDSQVIHKKNYNAQTDTLSGAQVIKEICELNGCFGVITNEGKFRFLTLPIPIVGNPLTTDITVGETIDMSRNGNPVADIKGVYVREGNVGVHVAYPWQWAKNEVVVAYNTLISDYTQADLQTVAWNILDTINGLDYSPLTIQAIGNPLHEVGDPICIWTKEGYNIFTYIFERRLQGVQGMRDTYSCNGDTYLDESLNQQAYQTKEIASQVSNIEQATSGQTTDFVETIRNIGFRLLDEPSNVSLEYDEDNNEVSIKWTDPSDIATNEPCPATWAGTVVVRKENSAPRHRWDGTLIVDSTTRDAYSVNALVDNTLASSKNYYYGIFPYDTKDDYRFTKIIRLSSPEISFETFEVTASDNFKFKGSDYSYISGSWGVYDSNTDSMYFANNCRWWYSNAKISKKVLQSAHTLIVTIVAKTSSSTVGLSYDMCLHLRNSSYVLMAVIVANGNDEPEFSDLISLNNQTVAWQGTAPLDYTHNTFKEIRYELGMSNGTVGEAKCYVDNVLYGTHIFNTALNLTEDEYDICCEALDRTNVKSYRLEVI